MCDDLGILLWETATQGAHSTLPGSEDASFFAVFTLLSRMLSAEE